ncbi:MAG TPA: hypothetical protein VGB32_12850 [Candidatus Bathyarchaeia archaeon]
MTPLSIYTASEAPPNVDATNWYKSTETLGVYWVRSANKLL